MFRSHIPESAPSFGCCMPRRGGYRTQPLSWFCCQWQLEYTCKQTTLTWRRLLPSTTRDERWTVCADRNYDDDSCPFLVGRELHAQHACQWRWVRGMNKHSVMRVKKSTKPFLNVNSVKHFRPSVHALAFYVLIKLLTTWQFFLCRANAWNQTTDR